MCYENICLTNRNQCFGLSPGQPRTARRRCPRALSPASLFARLHWSEDGAKRSCCTPLASTSGRPRGDGSPAPRSTFRVEISKAGDADVRHSLYEAASGLMTRFQGRDKAKTGAKSDRQTLLPPQGMSRRGAQAGGAPCARAIGRHPDGARQSTARCAVRSRIVIPKRRPS